MADYITWGNKIVTIEKNKDTNSVKNNSQCY